MNDLIFERALALAKEAYEAGEIPVGAVIFRTDTKEIVAEARNRTEELKDPTAHAEILCVQKACQTLGIKRLVGYSLFVTVEPCAMCAGAIGWARLDGLYFGAYDPKTGGVMQGAQVFTHPQTHHKIKTEGGIRAKACGDLMTAFFKERRQERTKEPLQTKKYKKTRKTLDI